jgi:hypothetical protein
MNVADVSFGEWQRQDTLAVYTLTTRHLQGSKIITTYRSLAAIIHCIYSVSFVIIPMIQP